jgi:hypothetical protein
LIVFVHGLAGVGKSTLVQAFAVEARERGATVLRLDCRAIEPTERGFLAALASATGAELPTTADAAARLESLGDRVVLVLDTYEVFRLFDSWLQERFVAMQSDNVRVVLSGREAPMTGWASSFGSLFRSLPLGGLPSEDAELLLRLSGVEASDADRINRIARGHPLSLRLAASALQNRPDINIDAITVQAIVEELTELYLDGLDPMARQALDAAAVVRRPTMSLIAAMLPDAAPQDAFDRLLGLPFVEMSDDGLVVHDTVRETVAAHLRSSDPDRSRRYRAAAWRQLRAEVTRASSHELWRYTADLLYILQNPIVRELRRAWSVLDRPSAILAELTYNHMGRTANAGLRPAVFTHEIELPGDCASPGARVLGLRDLVVRFDRAADRFVLRLARAPRTEVIPVINSGVNPVGFMSFVVAIGEQSLQPIGYFPGFDVPGVTHWPRVIAGRLVLFREHWVFRRGEWPRAPVRGDDLLAFARAALSWRERWLLPRHVFVHSSKAPKPRYIDLASPVFLDLLRRDLVALDGEPDAALHVTEMFPGPDDLFVRDPNGSHAAEFLVQLDGGPVRSVR